MLSSPLTTLIASMNGAPMSADNKSREFSDSIRMIADAHLPSDLALTVARMLAAVRLWPTEREGVPGFLDQSRELTKADWLAMLQAMGQGRKASPGQSDDPFDRPAEELSLKPGALERLRRLILGFVSHGDAAASVPLWLLQNTLDLTEQHDLFGRGPRGLDPKLRDLIVKVVGARAKARVLCAYDGAASIALELAAGGADVTLDMYPSLAPLCTCLALAGDLRLRVRPGDPLELARADISDTPLVPDLYDTSVVLPPFNMRREPPGGDGLDTGLPRAVSSDAAGVTLALARGKKAALCVLPPSFLFQTTKADQVFKEQAIRRYGLDTIAGLPRGVFGGSSIAAALLLFKPAVALLDQPRNSQEVFIINAHGGWDHFELEPSGPVGLAGLIENREPTDISLTVTVDDLAANDFNLSVERYVLEPEARRMRELTASANTVSLEDIAELYRPQTIPGAKRAGGASEMELVEVGVADIDEAGLVRSPGKQLAVTPDVALQARRARLEAGDVLLVVKGSVGKVGFIREIPQGATWLASQSFVILRLRQHSPLNDPRVLFRFLTSSLGHANIQSFRVGAHVPGLQMADVRRLSIIVPDRKTQELIAKEVDGLFGLQDQIQQLRADLTDRQGRIWPGSFEVPPRETAEPAPPPRKPPLSRKKVS